jgi:hypothetical protein
VVKAEAKNVPPKTKGYGSPEGIKNIEVHNSDGKWLEHGSAFLSLSAATIYVGKEAVSLVCDGCPFSKMSGLEVSGARALAAEERLAVAHNEIRRLEATEALANAYEQIAEIQQRVAPQLPPALPQ